ncbi:hypothetical protein BBO99_00004547 [Phytophthora kernoviae]|uniref:Major facilitator superfamily (MFS) profile domain-containing protein n=2 Tax=Phytophthora kernoviae TaxID=325452 RepID=A0A3R7FVP6_9STRA|nr:hypothetical protein G195_005531 [Phytophthora kernoviae 00238/432]RLM96128.1 hypothetical protein BBI17_004673 [Phytophthora kernoviae]RLN80373.1 hypothetical protein BBO99_00004547 [Phytophthora kernoviae]
MTEDETNELLWLREQKRRPEPSRAAISKQHVEEPKDDNCGGIGGFKRRTWVLFSVMGGLIYGYNVSLAATLQYMRDDLELSSTQEEALSATATLSDASSMLLGGYLADRFGRKATAMFACYSVVSVLFAARFVIARFSRRQVYLICLVVVCGCFVVSGAIFARYSTDDFARSSAASASIMATFAVLNVFAAVGPSILFVVILSELFQDNSYRARYMSYCTFAMSLISLLVNGSMLTLFETFGTATTFLAYGASYVDNASKCECLKLVMIPEWTKTS